MSLITRYLPPDAKGFKLTFSEMDNNLYYLQSLGVSGLTYSANTLTITNPTGGTKSVKIVENNNRWYIPSGETITIDSFYQSFIYGDVVVEGTLDIKENAQLVVLNGDLISSGGTIVQSGDTYLIDLPLVDTSIDSFVYSDNTFTITDSTGGTFSTVLNVVTGLTVNGDLTVNGTSKSNIFSGTTISADTIYPKVIDLCENNGTLYTDTISGCSPIDILSFSIFHEGLSGNTISGGTFYGDGSNLTGLNSITGATNLGTGVTIFDSVSEKTIRLNSITGDDTDKIKISPNSNTIEVGIVEQNLDIWPLVVRGNKLLNGGVSYVSGLTFNVSPLEYIIGDSIYTIPNSSNLILNSGDTTYDRIDVIIADISGNTLVVEGSPSVNPEKPNIDETTQLEITFIIVPASSVTLDITSLILYNDNLGTPSEWNFGSVGSQPTRIIGSSTEQAYSGTTSIRVSGVTGNFTTSFRLTGGTSVDTSDYSSLQFAIRNLSANTTTSQIRIRFLTTSGTQNGSAVFMNAAGTSNYVQYNNNNTSSWQLISIPLWRFYLTNNFVQVLEISFNSSNARYYFDLIELIEGYSTLPPQNTWTTIKGNGTPTITAPNPNSTLTISGGTNISSSISGTSTVVLNLYGVGEYSNVIFVDSVNGNDSTGVVNNFNKPFQSISLACAAATALSRSSTDRALIYIRRGNYTWNGYLIDYCNFYSEPGVVLSNGRISDLSAPAAVNCDFLGYAFLNQTDIYVSKASTVKFQFSKMVNNNAAFLFIPVGGTANIVVEADYIYSQTIGTSYLGTVRGSSNVTITVKDKIESPYSHWTFRNSYSGTFILNCPQSILLTGGTYTGSKQIVYATDVTSTAKIVINGDLISTDSTYYGGTSALVSLWGFGAGYFELNGDITTDQNVSVYSNITNSAGRAKINGSVYSALRPVVSINNGTTLIQNGTILTTTTGVTNAEAVFVAGTSKLYLMNCFIVAGTDFSVTRIDSATALFQIYNCIGYSPGTLGDCVTSITPGYTVRMSNFKSNKPLSVNVTDVLSPTGLSVDANVIAPNF